MEIGSNLKNHRMAKQLTQEEVAKKLHVSRTTISSWETGRTFPDIEKLIYLSDLYELSLDQLLREEPSIMETIVKERKSLKRYNGLKILGLSILTLFLLYNIYWFTLVYPKNTQLADWRHTEANNYLKKYGYTFQAHDIHYPMFLINNNIPVAMYGKMTFQMNINGDYANIVYYDEHSDKLIIGKFNRSKGLSSLKAERGSIKELKTLIKKNQKEVNDMYEATEKVWKSVNQTLFESALLVLYQILYSRNSVCFLQKDVNRSHLKMVFKKRNRLSNQSFIYNFT